ncbi:hypothetical protein VTJ49DRAFT_4253 [Mycothermus thermophilus]|uniref:Heterokaryon incompatibility domain-containing protein n=1 Tax=Humicola insolens TaxID=85995 RepID=A0ABR3VLK4_HUMIN
MDSTSPESPSPYKYTPLSPDVDDEIRLLYLEPGSGNDPIVFTLHPARLSQTPAYEAISYNWGDATQRADVLCDGKGLSITVSLFSALRRLRRPHSVRVLWADAVCINQDDIPEKNKQILLMRDIYTCTTRVLIWLGESSPELAGLDECLRTAKDLLPPEVLDWEDLYRESKAIGPTLEQLRREGKPNFADMDWTPLANLMLRPWFGRRWVIQETALADNNVPRLAICGDIEFSWDDLASVAYRLGSYSLLCIMCGLSTIHAPGPSMFAWFADETTAGNNLSNTFMVYLLRYFRSHNLSLVDGVVATAMFKCTDSRDHLYSLMSLFRIPPGLKPDYAITMEDMCLRFATAMLVSEQNLKTLTLAPDTFIPLGVNPSTPKRLALPSWAPDLSRQGMVQPLVAYTIRPQLFHAGGTLPPDTAVSTDPTGRVLRLRGRLVDAIAALVPPQGHFPPPQDHELAGRSGLQAVLSRRLLNWITECLAIAVPFPNGEEKWVALHAADQTFRRDFYEALMCGMTGMRDPVPEELLEAAHIYCLNLFATFTEPGYQPSPKTLDILHKYGVLIENPLMNVGTVRSFCCTAEGRLGQVRHTAQKGDVFCVVLGAEVPYLLRPSPGKPGVYTLIGDAYLQGMMQGEALVDARYETVDIFIE